MMDKWNMDDFFVNQPEQSPLSRILGSRHRNEKLEAIGTPENFTSGEKILRAGEIPDCCFLLRSGEVVGTEKIGSGDRLVYYWMERNTLFGEANMLLRRPLPVCFQAVEDAYVVRISRQALCQLMQEDSTLLTQLLLHESEKFLTAMDDLGKMRSHSATWLVCDLLLTFAKRYGVFYDDKVLIEKKITINLMTSMLGINRATTVRSLRSLRDLNLIENINGYYCIRSIERMKMHQEMLSNL